MNNRIKQIRLALNMSKEEFGNRLSIGKASVSKIELGTNKPSSQTIQLICSQFRVNSEWLKDGADVPMFLDDETDEELVDRIIQGDDPWKREVILSLCGMPQECWDAVRTLVRHFKSVADGPDAIQVPVNRNTGGFWLDRSTKDEIPWKD